MCRFLLATILVIGNTALASIPEFGVPEVYKAQTLSVDPMVELSGRLQAESEVFLSDLDREVWIALEGIRNLQEFKELQRRASQKND